MIAWVTYALLVGVLAGLAALAAERAAEARGWATRWIWSGALLLATGLPLAAWALPASPTPAPFPGLPGAYVLESLPVMVEGGGGGGFWTAGRVALLAWALVSAGLLAGLVAMLLRLRARAACWSARRIDGMDVLVSRSTGPAALGVLRGRVVVPAWALELDDRRRRLLLVHELEHVRARDPQLALAGLVVCALAPWHLPLWWLLRRLRLAIEVDCDARVLRQEEDVGGYGALLVEVGQRRTRLAVALAEPRSMLERRIRMIVRRARRRQVLGGLIPAAVAAGLLVVACETPGPTEIAPAPEAREPTISQALEARSEECAPAYILNGETVSADALDPLDPGRIESIEVIKGAREVPASAGSGQAPQRCGMVIITTKDATAAERERTNELTESLRRQAQGTRKSQTLAEVESSPTFTPMTVRPTLRNPGEVQAALQDYYPPLLRDAGIGGTVSVWFLLDRHGKVVKALVNDGAGHEALDQAALRVADVMAFTPAYNRDEPVPVWISLDVTFEQRSTGTP